MQRLLAGIAIVAVVSAFPQAQYGLTGKWQGETRDGAELVLDVVAKETSLSGTISRNTEVSKITDGKVSKTVDGKASKISFTFKAQLGERVEELSGELAEDEIRIWLERQGPSTAIRLKRVKN